MPRGTGLAYPLADWYMRGLQVHRSGVFRVVWLQIMFTAQTCSGPTLPEILVLPVGVSQPAPAVPASTRKRVQEHRSAVNVCK